MLRSGRLSGEPDVLQYFKSQQTRRPIRTINLSLCEQVAARRRSPDRDRASLMFDGSTFHEQLLTHVT